MKALRIGVCGNGTVGGGTIDLLRGHADLLAARAGCELHLCRVGARRARADCDTAEVPVHSDLMDLARADDLDVVVECIGGTTLALELVRTALQNGKSVVTANKALIAEHGNELLALAETNNVSLLCEAAVAGGIPILKALREGMAANAMCSIAGIINGTGNFILSAMEAQGQSFAEALKEAQALGYAEADPTFDVEGIDAAHKLAILASMAFAIPLNFESVHCDGISEISAEDITLAGELGYRIKHLGIAKQGSHGVELRVHPTLLPSGGLLANVNGVLNAVRLDGHAAGETVYCGAGAGRLPTASSIVADLVDLARADGRAIHCLGVAVSDLSPQAIVPTDEVCTAWYVRVSFPAGGDSDAGGDEHGMTTGARVKAQVLDCLTAEGINVAHVLEKLPAQIGEAAQLALVSDAVPQKAIQRALAALNALSAASLEASCIRVEDAL
ncbi:MAG: homoserine dehydrogenase [Congregibacter sp.]